LTASSLRSYGITDSGSTTQATAIIFFAVTYKAQIQVGRMVEVQIKNTQQALEGTIKRIDEITLTLNQARQRYHLSAQALASIPQPALVTLITLNPTGDSLSYNGKPVTARTQVAIQNVFYLFYNVLTTSGAS
jgi:hypothetical protein